MNHINFNCDVGEGMNNESLLMPYIQSCNIACGAHAGDVQTMNDVIKLAIDYNVKIGAHPSYPDRMNFGRKTMELGDRDFINEISTQIKLLEDQIVRHSGRLNHIKPHGALYNDIAKSSRLTFLFLSAIANYKDQIELYFPFNSVASKLAIKEDFKVVNEVFADRNYMNDYSLVARSHDKAVLHKPKEVLSHVQKMVRDNGILTIDGSMLPVKGETYCVHSDTKNAVEILRMLHKEFNHE